MVNVIGSVLAWPSISLLIGTSGESRSQSLLAELSTFIGTSGMLFQLLGFLPMIVADGLLVRFPYYGLDFLSHSYRYGAALNYGMTRFELSHCL